jgi:hypothetical protein
MTKLKFKCNELNITNEMLGFTIAFSDSKAVNEQFHPVSELLNCNDYTLLLQKTFGEHNLEKDYFYIEASDENIYIDSNEKINIF